MFVSPNLRYLRDSAARIPLAYVSMTVRYFLVGVVLLGAWWTSGLFFGEVVVVEIVRVPDGGRMPRAVIDEADTVHLVYFEGVMSGGELLYVTRDIGDSEWTEPTWVNSEPRSVVGVGPIDGGQLTLDANARLHIVWFQTNPTRVFYTRSTDDRHGFEPQRTLWSEEDGSFEASPTVTTDDKGNVFVFWHAGGAEDADRAVHMMMSHDGGNNFGAVRRVSKDGEGACGCCNMAAFADSAGTVYVSYRGAGENVRRGQRLLTSGDAGHTLADESIHGWQIGACPVTTTTLSEGPSGVRVAWETDGQVYFAPADRLDNVVSPEGEIRFRRKNPVVAVNTKGDTLLAWGDGPGLRAGGALHWQLFDANGQPIQERGDEATVPSGSAPTAVVRADDSFLLLF